MNREAGTSSDATNRSPLSEFDELVAAFERVWQAGERPEIDEFLTSKFGINRQALLVELIHVDLEHRLAAGESARLEEYLSRFSDLNADQQAMLGLIRSEYEMRSRREPGLEIGEYIRRFPWCRDLLPQWRRSPIQADPVVERRNDLPHQTPIELVDGRRQTAATSCTDHNLLFGILALQNGFVVGKQLIAAMNAWVLEKQTPLGQILLRQEALKPDELMLVETTVARHLAVHGDDSEQSQADASTLDSLRDQAGSVVERDAQANPADAAQGRPYDPNATIVHSVGETTSAGSRFRIVKSHAKGGLGEVFVAHDEELRRDVALKQIQDRYADHAESRSRFLLEAEITGGLEHPGIVPVYSLGTYASGRPFYAMRFIRGESLKTAIEDFHEANKSSRREPGERALQLRKLLGRMIDVCNAIEYAHAHGVLHRDLKPANIMLGKYGETLVVDWGMAKVIGRQDLPEKEGALTGEVSLRRFSGHASATRLGSTMGTPQFMSPEQAAGRHDELGPASDVYSLGATLYCMLAGEAPLTDFSRDVDEILRRVQRGDIAPPRQIKADIPKPLDAICRKSMALAPEDRYRSARALADDLEHWLADEPTTAQSEGLYDRLFRLARRHRGVALSTTAAAILIAVVATVAAGIVNEQRKLSDDLAQKNLQLANDEERARKEAEESNRAAVEAGGKAKQQAADNAKLAADKTTLAEKNAGLLLSEQQANKVAGEAARTAEKERVKAEASAKSEQLVREKAEKLSDFLVGAIQPDDPIRFTGATFYAPKADAKTFTVAKMLSAEIKRAYDELGQEPLVKAAVLDSIGNVCRQLAEFQAAEKLLNQALKIRREKLSTDHPDLATSCFHTAWYYQERGEFEKAKPLYFEALAIREKLPDGKPLVAEVCLNLAWLYYYEDSPDETDKWFKRALAIREKRLKQSPHREKALLRDVVFTKLAMAGAFVGLASTPTGLGDRSGRKWRFLDGRAIASNPSFRKELIEFYGNNKLADALAHVIKAGDHIGLYGYSKAVDELEQALALIEGTDKAETILAGQVNFMLADTLAKLNRLPEADRRYQVGVDVARRERMLQVPLQAEKIKGFGDVLRRLGKTPKALELWEEYLAAQEFRFGKQHRFYKEAELAYQSYVRPTRPTTSP